MNSKAINNAITTALSECHAKLQGLPKKNKNELAFLAIWHLYFWEALKDGLSGSPIQLKVRSFHLDKSPIVSFKPSVTALANYNGKYRSKWKCELADIMYTFTYNKSINQKVNSDKKGFLIQAKQIDTSAKSSNSVKHDFSSIKQNCLTTEWPSFILDRPNEIASYKGYLRFNEKLMLKGYDKLNVDIHASQPVMTLERSSKNYEDFIYDALVNNPTICRELKAPVVNPRSRKIDNIVFSNYSTPDDWNWLITLISDKIKDRKFKSQSACILDKSLSSGIDRGKEITLAFIDSILSDGKKMAQLRDRVKFIYYDIEVESTNHNHI